MTPLACALLVVLTVPACLGPVETAPTTSPSPTATNPARGPCEHLWSPGDGYQLLLRAMTLPPGQVSTQGLNVTLERSKAVVTSGLTDGDGCVRLLVQEAGEYEARATTPDPASTRCSYDGRRSVALNAALVEDDLVLGKTCR